MSKLLEEKLGNTIYKLKIIHDRKMSPDEIEILARLWAVSLEPLQPTQNHLDSAIAMDMGNENEHRLRYKLTGSTFPGIMDFRRYIKIAQKPVEKHPSRPPDLPCNEKVISNGLRLLKETVDKHSGAKPETS